MTQANKSARKASIYFEELLKTLPSLADKTIAITGTTSGTGLVAARTCAALGATVIMLNRPSERAKNVLESLNQENRSGLIHHVDCDLQDFESVPSDPESPDEAAAGLCRDQKQDLTVLALQSVLAFQDLPLQ